MGLSDGNRAGRGGKLDALLRLAWICCTLCCGERWGPVEEMVMRTACAGVQQHEMRRRRDVSRAACKIEGTGEISTEEMWNPLGRSEVDESASATTSGGAVFSTADED